MPWWGPIEYIPGANSGGAWETGAFNYSLKSEQPVSNVSLGIELGRPRGDHCRRGLG